MQGDIAEMGALYIVIILMCRVVQHLYGKKTSNMVATIPETIRFMGFRECVSAVLALLLIIIGGNGFYIDLKTVVLSLIAGGMMAVSIACSMYAMKTGMVSLVALFGTAGMIIPCLAGVFLFDIPVSPMQWTGFAMFMIAAYFMILGSKGVVKGFSIKTMLLLLAVMIAEGFTMITQQMFTQYVPNGNVSVFSFLSFGTVGAITMAVMPVLNKNRKMKPISKSLAAYGIILAAAILAINQFATLATAIVPPIILFTFINGGSTVIAAIVAAVIYKEKLTVKSVLGIILGVLSFVIIKAAEI